MSAASTDYDFREKGVTVLIPAYNETGAIVGVLREIESVLASIPGLSEDKREILIIDDGSKDDTAAKAKEAGGSVIRHKINFGYGASLKTGLRHAKFETIVIADADGTYPSRYIPALLEEMAECDMAVGARIGENVHIPWERRPAKWLLNSTAEFLSGRKIADINSGLRAFKKTEALRFIGLYPSGFSFTTTITLSFLASDLIVNYIPIDYRKRTGRSKLHPIRDTKNLFLTVLRCILFFNPLRVCVPVSIMFFLLAAYVFFFVRDNHGNLMDGTLTVLVCCGLQVFIMGFLADILARWRA